LMSNGDVEGFAAVAFPIVRRVFGSLIANDLVSVQPMSLPSGLIFFLDFKFSEEQQNGAGRLSPLDYAAGESIYGQGVLGSQLTGGVSINEDKQPYGFQTGFSSATGSATLSSSANSTTNLQVAAVLKGQRGDNSTMDKLCRYDADIPSGTYIAVYSVGANSTNELIAKQADITEGGLANITVHSGTIQNEIPGDGSNGGLGANQVSGTLIRRLTQFSGTAKDDVLLVFQCSADPGAIAAVQFDSGSYNMEFVIADNLVTGSALGSVAGADTWGLEASADIPEIEIKVDSVSVTARTKKLKAKWSPELGQDLNAYHNLDAEVELTSILSEQIALEIDREILADLIQGATAGKFYWSRSPGLFVNKSTGAPLVSSSTVAPDFTGNVSEWYETLIETINDVSAQIHRKTLRGGANFLVCGPEVANILEFTSGFRAKVSHADEKGQVGAVNVGSISKKFDVMVDPYFPRNVILVGRKGNSFLESGYVYAPYVPLQVTPTIFGTEDFVPRKGVMTRYAKKMVRPDMYGLVIVQGLLGDASA